MASVFQQLQSVLWFWVGLLLAVALVSAVLRSATFKGWLGERMVRRWLAQDLDAAQYHCVHNVTLRLADGSTTQIDHVVVSPYGVFVVETKHMKGWILGGERQNSWTQIIFRRRTSFQNPLHQNWRHIKALEEVLQLPLCHLYSVVVFTGDCHFKTAMPANVVQGRDCTALIQRQVEHALSTHDVQRILQTLAQRRLQASRSTHKEHVAQLQARHRPAGRKAVEPRQRPAPVRHKRRGAAMQAQEAQGPHQPQGCPACGAALQQRVLPDAQGVARGFWRCVRFPHCRFLQVEDAQGIAQV